MSSSKDAEEPTKKESNPPPVDSDEEDEDYVPGQDPDEVMASDDENDITTNQTTNEDISSLSITKQKAVDDAFNELFGFNYTDSTTKKSSSKVPVKSKSAIQKQKNIII